MSTQFVRLLPFESLSGPDNMAADEVTLRAAAETGVSSLRFYTWARPTLSLGYFQAEAPRRGDPLLSGVDWVRRPTGGAAIMHHRELTYCLALPSGAPWQGRGSWICRFHDIIAGALEEFGVRARPVSCGEDRRLGEFLCFLHQTPGDLLLGTSKVTGSAQRKLRGALLQHGSILLRRSPYAPMLPGISDLSGVPLTPEELQARITRQFTSRFGWRLEAATWSAGERGQAREIAAAKYSSTYWNERR